MELFSPDDSSNYVAIANSNLARNISAALRLGDTNFLGSDMNWLESLLLNRRLPLELLRQYLVAYHRAASEHLDQRGAPILAWLATLVGADA